jgi:hypothetical protein
MIMCEQVHTRERLIFLQDTFLAPHHGGCLRGVIHQGVDKRKDEESQKGLIQNSAEFILEFADGPGYGRIGAVVSGAQYFLLPLLFLDRAC